VTQKRIPITILDGIGSNCYSISSSSNPFKERYFEPKYLIILMMHAPSVIIIITPYNPANKKVLAMSTTILFHFSLISIKEELTNNAIKPNKL